MPAKSKKQERLMRAVIGNPSIAAEKGITPEEARRVLGIGEAKKKKKSPRRSHKGTKGG